MNAPRQVILRCPCLPSLAPSRKTVEADLLEQAKQLVYRSTTRRLSSTLRLPTGDVALGRWVGEKFDLISRAGSGYLMVLSTSRVRTQSTVCEESPSTEARGGEESGRCAAVTMVDECDVYSDVYNGTNGQSMDPLQRDSRHSLPSATHST
jgi:hypothetical protein